MPTVELLDDEGMVTDKVGSLCQGPFMGLQGSRRDAMKAFPPYLSSS